MPTAHIFVATGIDNFIAREDGSIDLLPNRGDSGEDHGHRDLITDVDGVVMERGSFEAGEKASPRPHRMLGTGGATQP